jgi:hypothetical protein
MEGRIAPGQEAFSAFLINCTDTYSSLPIKLLPILKLYISLSYGDPHYSPPLPFMFAKMYGFFPELINPIQQEAEEKVRREQEALKDQELEKFKRSKANAIALHNKNIEKKRTNAWHSFCHTLNFKNSGTGGVKSRFLKEYKRIYHNSRFMELLLPYCTARFAEPWASGFPYLGETSSSILRLIRQEREVTRGTFAQKSSTFSEIRKKFRNTSEYDPYLRSPSDLGFPPRPLFDLDYLDEVEQFVMKYQEKGRQPGAQGKADDVHQGDRMAHTTEKIDE